MKMMSLALCNLLFSCAALAIVGGREIDLPDPMAKFTVGLADASKTQHCTASLIAADMAISAAHCVATGNDSYLIFGADADADSAVILPIYNYEYNPLYDKNSTSEKDRGDIVVLHFKKAIPQGYAPAEMLPGLSNLDQIKTVSLAGYGATSYMPGDPTAENVGTLRRVDGIAVDDIHFTSTEFTLKKIPGKGICHGDSGGPAAAVLDGHTYLFGVTSRPHPYTVWEACDEGATFTSILAYSDWIIKTADKLRSSGPTPRD
jgi:hypothetical protein